METGSSAVDDDGPQRLGLLASALAGRTVAVAPGDRGDPAWTDGVTVFVDPAETAGQQLEAVTVQASLLAGGGLEPDVVRKLLRRPALAKKYLAVEGQRSLAANEDLLPLPVRSLIDLDLATRTDSPATSLAVAGSRNVADPPASFGVIKARSLLTAHPSVQQSDVAGAHDPRRKSQKELPELDDDAEDSDGTDVMDPVLQPGRRWRRGREAAAALDEQGPPTQRRRISGRRHPDTPVAQGNSRCRIGHLDGRVQHRRCG